MIQRNVIDQVIETANSHIVEVVQDYVQLRRRGANYMGCCPFHSEKTPSFSVSPAKGYCYCFGCHKGGSAVSFIMEIEKLSFPDAIRHLGQRFGIEIEEEAPSAEALAASKKRDALYAVLEYAARHFESNMRDTTEGLADGLSYFRHRGFRDDTISAFRLGYAMKSRQALLLAARQEGYKEEYLLEAGLISGNDGGHQYDKFSDRVIFPIQNSSGKVIGFGGRVLDSRTKGVSVKYLNSPETELYIKSNIVYGIYQARTEISRKNKCFLVEGYTDVISMHQSGIANVVASSGTALTVNQIRLIKRFTENITVLYDGDSAGVHASLRGIDMILHEGMNVRLLLLPDGEDPDSFARKTTAEEFQSYVEANETDFIRFEAERMMAAAGNNSTSRSETIHTIVNSIAEVQDRIKREVYIKECSRIMDISVETLFEALQERMTANAISQRDRDVAEQRMKERREQAALSDSSPTSHPPISQAADAMPTDLSPSEMAMLQDATPQKGRQDAGEVFVRGNDTEYAEVMRFFVTYNQVVMKRVKGNPTVADYIVEAINNDGLTPSNPLFSKIIGSYTREEEKGKVDVHYFMNSPDTDVCAFVAAAVGGRQELSHIHSKYTTIVDEVNMVDELVERAVNELRFKKLINTIDDAMTQMQQMAASGASDAELDAVMAHISDLNSIKLDLAKEMGDRSVIR